MKMKKEFRGQTGKAWEGTYTHDRIDSKRNKNNLKSADFYQECWKIETKCCIRRKIKSENEELAWNMSRIGHERIVPRSQKNALKTNWMQWRIA